MRYQLKMSSIDGVNDRYSDFSETEGVRGDIVIVFEWNSESISWSIKDGNVPLFLSNLTRFLRMVETNSEAVFTAQFSPNANGRMRDGHMFLSRTSGDKFDDGIYDRTTPDQLAVLKENIIADAKRFGTFSNL